MIGRIRMKNPRWGQSYDWRTPFNSPMRQLWYGTLSKKIRNFGKTSKCFVLPQWDCSAGMEQDVLHGY